MGRFKCGDLVLNKWAGKGNPLRVCVYLKQSGKYALVLYVDLFGKLESVNAYKGNIENDAEHYVLVGHTDAFDLLIADIINEREKWEGV